MEFLKEPRPVFGFERDIKPANYVLEDGAVGRLREVQLPLGRQPPGERSADLFTTISDERLRQFKEGLAYLGRAAAFASRTSRIAIRTSALPSMNARMKVARSKAASPATKGSSVNRIIAPPISS